MIKWLICFIWGHDLNRDPEKYVRLKDGAITIGLTSQCLRCLKYKDLYRTY